MGTIALETKISVYVWALMTNHAHIPLRSGPSGLFLYMLYPVMLFRIIVAIADTDICFSPRRRLSEPEAEPLQIHCV